jgi:hypothetical protein
MPDRLLHAVNVPSDSQTNRGSSKSKNIAKQGVLESDVSSAEAIAPQPGTTSLTGQFRGRYAPMLARMIEELFSSSIKTVPYTARGTDSESDGYYALEQLGSVGPLDAREDRIQKFDGALTKKGTRRSHWRAIRTNPQPADNPFGSASAPEVGLSIWAQKVRWFDDVGGGLEEATVQRRVKGEHDYLNIYDASEPAFDKPILIYDIPYIDEYPTDCVVWDTYNREKVYYEAGSDDTVGISAVGTATVSSDDVNIASQWQRVYVTDHNWRGDIVLETDRLRLVIEQPEDTLRAYRWDAGEGQYNIIQLGSSDWRLYDIDLTSIGLVRLEAQFEFENATTGNRYNLNGTLVRGLGDAIWTVPANEGTAPSGLIDRLDPIASESGDVVEASGDVVKRTQVNR